MHMCDTTYEEQQGDNRCMYGGGVTEFPAGTDRVYIIYCHKQTDTVTIEIKDAGGGTQYVNHPDGETYVGEGCESLGWWPRHGIPSAGSPYYTTASWPEGPFSGVGAGIEWYIGLYVAFDAEHYYGNHAEARISARDPAANINPTEVDTITVRVTSTSDPAGIELVLEEERAGFPIFTSSRALRFSQFASNQSQGVIRVADRDIVTVSYCPRDCKDPYTDSAQWHLLEATITPTPLPTWSGPPPTSTPTPPPGIDVDYIVVRPAAADVGYVPEVSTNPERPNHLGYPSIYSGSWTRGRNRHYGMVQFDLSSLPPGGTLLSARLELVGRESRFAKPGSWEVKLLDSVVDAGWRDAAFDDIDSADTLGTLAGALRQTDLAVGHTNSLGFDRTQLDVLGERLRTTRRLSLRIDGPDSEDNNLFAWHSGVDVYGREKIPPDPELGPALYVAMAEGQLPGEATPTTRAAPTETATAATPTATITGGGTPTATVAPTPSSTGSPRTPTADPTNIATATSQTPPGPTPSSTGGAPPSGRMLCVLAFDDFDGNGTRSATEKLLPDLTLQLTNVVSGAYIRRTTDGANDPDYCWDGLSDGEYVLEVVQLPFGYETTSASLRRFDVPFPFVPAFFAFGARAVASPPPAPSAGTPTADMPTDTVPTAGPTESPAGSPTATTDRRTKLYLPLTVVGGSRSG
jgi:hypothetical protein